MKRIPLSQTEKVLICICSLELVGMFLYAFYMYSSLPATIPIEYTHGGKPEVFASKSFLWLFPGMIAVAYIFITFLMCFPHNISYPENITTHQREGLYTCNRLMLQVFAVEVISFFFYIQLKKGNEEGLHMYALPIFLIIIGGTVVCMIMKYKRLQIW